MLKEGRDATSLLWPISPSRVIQLFLETVALLGMAMLKPVRYSLRHGGASDDILTRRRSLLEVKRRGQWRTDQSLRRYGKETKAMEELQKLPAETLSYARLVSQNLSEVFNRTMSFPPPTLGSHVIAKPPLKKRCVRTSRTPS